jgi:hypothetical protein
VTKLVSLILFITHGFGAEKVVFEVSGLFRHEAVMTKWSGRDFRLSARFRHEAIMHLS